MSRGGKPELTARLQAVADLVPPGTVLADIGTDHAFLPVWLLLEGKIPRAIAADLKEGPLERAKLTARQYRCQDRMDFRLCDGLQGIEPGECGCVAVAGMGGETIVHILAQAPWLKEAGVCLVLQPMSTQAVLRRFLCETGYTILMERTIREGDTLYTIISAKGGEVSQLSQGEAVAGRQRRPEEDPLRGELLCSLEERTARALEGLGRSRRDEAARRREELEELYRQLQAMRKEWQQWL